MKVKLCVLLEERETPPGVLSWDLVGTGHALSVLGAPPAAVGVSRQRSAVK